MVREERTLLVLDGGGHARRGMTSHEPWLGHAELAILRMIGLFDRPVDAGEISALRAEPVVKGLPGIEE